MGGATWQRGSRMATVTHHVTILKAEKLYAKPGMTPAWEALADQTSTVPGRQHQL